jgi:site-specific DNA recombinase
MSFSNPFYYGVFRYNGDIYEGKHKPLIEKRLWDKVQNVLIERGHPQRTGNDPKPLCGLLHCGECGRMITAEVQKTHTYYRCTKKSKAIKCSQSYVREEILVSELSNLLSQFSMPKEIANELTRRTNEEEIELGQKTAMFVQDLREKVQGLSRNLERLTDLYVAQDIEREDYLSRRKAIISQKRSLEEQIARLEQNAGSWLEPMREWINDASLLAQTATNDDLSAKKAHLQKIFGSNLFLINQKLKFVPIKPYASLREALKIFPEKGLSMIGAPGVGFEPTTNSLTASCATAALPGNRAILDLNKFVKAKLKLPLKGGLVILYRK